MRNRIAWGIIGILVLVCIGLIFSVVYPFSTANSHETSTEERFTAGESDEYELTGTLVVDGRLVYGFEGIVTADGDRYSSLEGEEMRYETYQSGPNRAIYTKIETAERQADFRLNSIEHDDDRELLLEERNGEDVTLIVVEETADDTATGISSTAEQFIRSLYGTQYERIEERDEEYVYEPQEGWFDDQYRVTDSTGDVTVDADTHEVVSANVSWDVTRPAETYAHYLLARLSDDSTETYEITYEFDEGDSEVIVPDWVENARAER
ncbi:hypothetical protein [Halomontanus rarus]|uniref:hypothetical protein n=1 Tax=Halomontanus rarus TaxID=3034020 RepID=UPI0023E8261E|nr:hypothetical protein [Halovivax sp. TS33]